MSLERLKQTIARVEIDGEPVGTAFLIDRNHAVTALHVLDGARQVELVFPEWPSADQVRHGSRQWRHPAGFDVVILGLDRESPPGVEPLLLNTNDLTEGEEWTSWGFPRELTNGHTLSDKVRDPALLIDGWDLRILQLETPAAAYELGGMSGAPCMIGGRITGVITHQLYRDTGESDGGKTLPKPALNTLYALPISLLIQVPLELPIIAQDRTPSDSTELIRMVEKLAPEAKASFLAKVLRDLDPADAQSAEDLTRRAAIVRYFGTTLRLVVHIVWRRGNEEAAGLARDVYLRLTRSALDTTAPGLRIPTFLHDQPTFLDGSEPLPIAPDRVEHSVIVLLLDNAMFSEDSWRDCHERIVARGEGDALGTSVLPVGVDGPKQLAPFDEMRVSNLAGSGSLYRLLIALEVRLLTVMLRRPADREDGKCVRIFLSFASADGRDLAVAVRNLAQRTPGIEAVLDDSVLGPGDRFDKLLKVLADSVFLAFRTPRYTGRAWCRQELLEAKRLGLPIVVVEADAGNVPRVFPYLGNVPAIRWREDGLAPHAVLEAATFEALRDRHARQFLGDQTLLDESLRAARILTRPPELMDLVGDGPLADLAQIEKPVVLHPDPPLADEERRLLRATVPALRVASPGLALVEARALRRAGDARPLRIALSASLPDLLRPGLGPLHFDDVWLDLIRLLLLGGATLLFGGDLRPGGLTDLLLEVADQRTAFDRRAARPPGKSRPKMKAPLPIRSFLAWPFRSALPDERVAQLVDQVGFENLPPPPGTPAAAAPRVPPASPEDRYLLARSLTHMRYRVLGDADATVVIGGKSTGSMGRYAGVVEETLLAIRARKPVFVLGGIGGAAAEVGAALRGGRPRRLTAEFQLDSASTPRERADVEHYNERIVRERPAEAPEPIDHEAVLDELNRAGQGDFAGLNNGLTRDENELLLGSPSMPEVVPLLYRGLRTLCERKPEPASPGPG